MHKNYDRKPKSSEKKLKGKNYIKGTKYERNKKEERRIN